MNSINYSSSISVIGVFCIFFVFFCSGQVSGRFERCNGGECYILYPQNITWINAFEACSSEGAQLVAVESSAKYNFIRKMITDSGYRTEGFWTSGSDCYEEGRYFWMSTGRPFGSFARSNWATTEPSGTNYENCIILWGLGDFRFGDNRCNLTTNYFICEYRI